MKPLSPICWIITPSNPPVPRPLIQRNVTFFCRSAGRSRLYSHYSMFEDKGWFRDRPRLWRRWELGEERLFAHEDCPVQDEESSDMDLLMMGLGWGLGWGWQWSVEGTADRYLYRFSLEVERKRSFAMVDGMSSWGIVLYNVCMGMLEPLFSGVAPFEKGLVCLKPR